METGKKSWQPPAYENLKKSLTRLFSTYQSEANPARRQQIQLLESLLENDPDLLIEGLVYIRTAIKNEYIKSGKIYSLVRPAGKSQLYTLVSDALAISPENRLDDVSKFVCLSTFIREISRRKKHTPHLSRAISMAKSTKENIQTDIQKLTHRFPTDRSLCENFSAVRENYLGNAEKKPGLFNYLRSPASARIQAVRFLEALDERVSDSDRQENYLLRYGALLHVMHQIETEYRLRSPTNSRLYREIQRITHLNSSSDLCFELKQVMLTQLNSLLCQEHLGEEKLKLWQEHDINNADLMKIEEEILTYHTEMIRFRDSEFTGTPAANLIINGFLDCIARTIAQTGVIFACYQIARFMAGTSIPYRTLLALASPQNAAILMGSLWLITQFRSTVNNYATQTTQDFISPLLRIPLKALTRKKSLFEHLNDQSHISEEEKDLLQALYLSPDEIVSAEEKRTLKNLFSPQEFLSEPPLALPVRGM